VNASPWSIISSIIISFIEIMAESGRENWAVDELLKAEEEANNIIKNA
jgi:hypothetical protein